MPNPFALAEAFVSITGDDRPLDTKIRDAKLKVADLAKKSANIKIGADDKEARLALDDTRLKLLKLSQTTARPNINIQGIARANLELDKLSLKLDKLSGKSGIAKLTGASFLQPGAGGVLLGLLPSLIPAAAGVAGAVAGIGISFGAAGLAAIGFGALARTVLTDAGTDATKLAALNVRLNAATTASQKAAIKAQITALEKGWTPAYKQVMTGLTSLQAGWKKLAIQVAAPVIAPWLDVVTRALPVIKAALQPVADLFKSWGQSLDKYFSNPVTVQHLKDIAATFGNFAAIQLGQIGKFLADIAQAFFNLGKDIPPGTQLGAAGTALMNMGDAFLTWSKSKAARADVQAFFKFIHDEGGTVKSILKDLGDVIPGIFKGATTAGTLELEAIAAFLNLIAKLPKGWQAPLTEAAGAILLLAKTGVLKIGIQIVGGAAKLLTGGTLALGGGTAAAEIRAAFATGGAAAAAEIRAAMVGGGAVGGAEGAAGGAAGGAKAAAGGLGARLGIGGLLGSSTALAAAGAVGGAAIAAGLLLRLREDLKAGFQGFARDIPAWLSGIGGVVQLSAQGWADAIVSKFSKPVKASLSADWHDITSSFDAFRHQMSASWDALWGDVKASALADWRSIVGSAKTTWNTIKTDAAATWNLIWRNTVTRAQGGITDLMTAVRGLPGKIVAVWNTVTADTRSAWNTIWSNTEAKVSAGVTTVVTFFRGLPGKALAALTGLGHSLGSFAAAAMTEMLNGMKRIAGNILSWLGGFVGKIVGLVGKLLRLGSPSGVFFDVGMNMMLGLEKGIKAHAHRAANAAQSATSGAVGSLGGPANADARAAMDYARSRLSAYGWGQDQMSPLINLWNQESGWNRFARNPSSGAYGIPQALPPGKMGAAANPPTSSAAAQINWGLGYIKTRPGYGSPAAAEAHELAFHWYDAGGFLPPHSATVAVNATGRAERVTSGAGEDKLLDELRHIKRLLGDGNVIAARAPAQTGYGLGRAMGQATQRAMSMGYHSTSRPVA